MGRGRAQSVALGVSLVGVAVVVVGSFLPWARSGSRWRSSYQLLAVADRLGFTSGGLERWGVRLWPVVPLLGAAALAAALHHRLAGAVLAAIVGAYALVLVWRVAVAPLPGGAGLAVTAVGAMMAVVGAVVAMLLRPKGKAVSL